VVTARRQGIGCHGSRAAEPGTGPRPRTRPTLISVILPVFNGAAHIDAQLAALAAQDYADRWELLIVDNGCTDDSIAIARRWTDRLPQLIIIDARAHKSINHARTAGVAAADGDFLAFCDADDVVSPQWLSSLSEAAPDADLVGGRVEVEALNDLEQRAWQPSAPLTGLNSGYGFLPYVSGGNCGMWADVAHEVGWDQSFGFGASDIEFAWRAQLSGFRAVFEPRAVIRLRYRKRMLAMARQYFRYGVSEPHLFREFRGLGMPRRDVREALQTWAWLLRYVSHTLRGRDARGYWLRVAASNTGRVCGSLRWRVLYL